ncbi:MAG: hypothetical protein ACK4NX_01300 [Candidatus Paceibacteria bacterium]
MNEKLKVTIFLLVGLLVIAVGLLGYNRLKKAKISKIDSYEECVKAGYPVALSYPSTCRTPDGRIFTQY